MEDPKRMRTKLRLDLADVRKQIEDLEDLLRTDKSADNVEAHRKLVEYEKKLKDQYEKMTGLSVDQANRLEERVTPEARKSSPGAGIFGILAGLIVAWGYYNTILHSIVGFGPNDVLNWVSGTGVSAPNISYFMYSMFAGTSKFLVAGPLVGGSLLILLSSLADKNKNGFTGFIEGLAFLIPAGFLGYLLFYVNDAAMATQFLTNNILITTGVIGVSGILLLLTVFGTKGLFGKFLALIVAALFLASAVQLFLLSQDPSTVDPNMVWQWPYIIAPVMAGSGVYSIISLLRF